MLLQTPAAKYCEIAQLYLGTCPARAGPINVTIQHLWLPVPSEHPTARGRRTVSNSVRPITVRRNRIPVELQPCTAQRRVERPIAQPLLHAVASTQPVDNNRSSSALALLASLFHHRWHVREGCAPGYWKPSRVLSRSRRPSVPHHLPSHASWTCNSTLLGSRHYGGPGVKCGLGTGEP